MWQIVLGRSCAGHGELPAGMGAGRAVLPVECSVHRPQFMGNAYLYTCTKQLFLVLQLSNTTLKSQGKGMHKSAAKPLVWFIGALLKHLESPKQ